MFKRYALVAGTLILAYKSPDLYVKNRIQKRSDAIRKGLPDALDLLVICAEAGLTVDAAFNRVARELGKAYPELGDEFALTSIELGFLTDRRAFGNLARVSISRGPRRRHTMTRPKKLIPLAAPSRPVAHSQRAVMRAEESRRSSGAHDVP